MSIGNVAQIFTRLFVQSVQKSKIASLPHDKDARKKRRLPAFNFLQILLQSVNFDLIPLLRCVEIL